MTSINRNNPTTHESGMVICDSASSTTLAGESSYVFAGNPAGLASSQNVGAGNLVLFNSTSLLQLDSVFPGPAVRLTMTYSAVANSLITIVGYNNGENITETINVLAGTAITITTSNSYTAVNTIRTSAALTNVTVGTNPLVLTKSNGVASPQLAAALDINSSSGAILFPKASMSQIKKFDSVNNGVNYASTNGMRVYNTSTNNFCEKTDGVWAGLNMEDAYPASYKTASFYLNNANLLLLGTSTIFQILPPLPVYSANPTGLSGSQACIIGIKATLTGTMPYPAKVTIKLSANPLTNSTFRVTGMYNGITFSEDVSVLTIASTGSTVAKFSSVTSIVLLSGSVALGGTVTYGYGSSIACYVVHSATTVFCPSATAITGTGGVVLGRNGGVSAVLGLVKNSQLVQIANGILTITSYPNQVSAATPSNGGTSGLTISNDGTAFTVPANGSSSLFLTIKYAIVW